MNVKKSLENQIRGWFPQEPILPAHALPNKSKASKTKAIFLNLVLGFVIFAGLFCALCCLIIHG